MSLKDTLSYEYEAKKLRVSEVARSNRGFMRAYERARGDPSVMSTMLVPGINRTTFWGKRRDEFVARHMAQYRKPGGKTRRRWLALAMWAYKPPGRAPR
jgi:dipeptidase